MAWDAITGRLSEKLDQKCAAIEARLNPQIAYLSAELDGLREQVRTLTKQLEDHEAYDKLCVLLATDDLYVLHKRFSREWPEWYTRLDLTKDDFDAYLAYRGSWQYGTLPRPCFK